MSRSTLSVLPLTLVALSETEKGSMPAAARPGQRQEGFVARLCASPHPQQPTRKKAQSAPWTFSEGSMNGRGHRPLHRATLPRRHPPSAALQGQLQKGGGG